MILPDNTNFPLGSKTSSRFGNTPQGFSTDKIIMPNTPLVSTGLPQIQMPSTPPPVQQPKNPVVRILNRLPLPQKIESFLTGMVPAKGNLPTLNPISTLNYARKELFPKKEKEPLPRLEAEAIPGAVEKFLGVPFEDKSKMVELVPDETGESFVDKNETEEERQKRLDIIDVARAERNGFAQMATSVMQSIIRNITLGAKALGTGDFNVELKPTTLLEATITGVKPFDTFGLVDEGRDIASILGENFANRQSSTSLMVIGSLSAFSDMTFPGGKSGIQKGLQQIAKKQSASEIAKILKKIFPKLSDDVISSVAPRMARETSYEGVLKIAQRSLIADSLPRDVLQAAFRNQRLQRQMTVPLSIPKNVPQSSIPQIRRIADNLPEGLKRQQMQIDALDESIRISKANTMLDGVTIPKGVKVADLVNDSMAVRAGFPNLDEAKQAAEELMKRRATLATEVSRFRKAVKAHQAKAIKQVQTNLTKAKNQKIKSVAKQTTTKGAKTKKVVSQTTGLAKRTDESKELLNVLNRMSQSAKKASASTKKVERFKAKRELRRSVNSVQKQFKKNIDNVDGLKKIVRNFVNNRIPAGKREKLLNSLASIKGVTKSDKGAVTKINDVLKRAVNQAQDLQSAAALKKRESRLRSNVSFLTKVGQFKPTVIRNAKKALNLDKPIKKMNEQELSSLVAEMRKRVQYKYKNNLLPTFDKVRDIKINETFYNETLQRELSKKTLSNLMGSRLKIIKGRVVSGVDDALSIISTRLKIASPRLFARLRKMERDILRENKVFGDLVRPFFNKVKAMEKQDKIIYDFALKNGDAKKIKEINKKYGIDREYGNLRNALDELYRRAKSVGLEVGYLDNFIPRMVKDPEGFIKYMYEGVDGDKIRRVIAAKEAEVGMLTDPERAQVIVNLIRGYSGGNPLLMVPSQLKNRNIDVLTSQMNDFYYDSITAITRYIEDVNNSIEIRKFFGKKADSTFSLDDSLSFLINDLIKTGKLSPEKSDDVLKVLRGRFNPKGPGRFISGIKNVAYLDTLGSVISFVNQIPDLLHALRKYPGETIPALFDATIKRSGVTMKDLGLNNSLAQEFSNKNFLSRAVTTVFGKNLFEYADIVLKETQVNAALKAAQRAAKRGDMKFFKDAKIYLDNPTDFRAFLTDLRQGRTTENVKLFLFNELSNIQPITLSEMPLSYVTGGNKRVFYTLKSFGLKQIDIFRNVYLDEIGEAKKLLDRADKIKNVTERNKLKRMAKKKVVKGVRDLATLTGLIIAFNGGANIATDVLRGKEIEPREVFWDNLLKIVFLNRFTLQRASRDGIASAAVDFIMPPMRIFDSVSDVINKGSVLDSKFMRSVPFGGELWYWWIGGGANQKRGSGASLRAGNSTSSLNELNFDFNFDFDSDFDFNFDFDFGF